MNFRWKDPEQTNTRIEACMKQGQTIYPISARLDRVEVQLIDFVPTAVLILEDNLRVMDEFEMNAKRDCKHCNGHGWIRYWYAQDESRAAPCPICFPDNKKANEAAAEYTKWSSQR